VSETPQAEAPQTDSPRDSAAAWQVRPAREQDLEQVVLAVSELLVELGSTAPAAPEMREVARALIEDPELGAVLVADCESTLVGVLVASWQLAMHVPGSYALIQDLWVRPNWRGRAIGAALIEAFAGLARARGSERIEVGLPRERFGGFQATERFYLENGFAPLGPRMRRALS
jgi:GNAT superfamily N-acetyltransferase